MKKATSSILTIFLSVFIISAAAHPTVVNTQYFNLDVFVNTNYDADSIQFDLDQVLTDLGINSLSEALPVALQEDGSFSDVSNEGSGGFWLGSAGYIVNWGVGGVVYISHFIVDEGYIGLGQFPDSLATYVDEALTFTYGFKANDKIEVLKITVNIAEVPPITGTIVNTQNIDVNILPNTDYSQDVFQYNIEQTLTDLDIVSIGEAKAIALLRDGSYNDDPTADNGGYWFSRDGYKSNWGSGGIVYITHENFDEGYAGIGQFPDSLVLGEVFTVKYAFLANDKIEMLNITVNVKAVPVIVNTQDLSLSVYTKSSYLPDSLQFDLSQTLTDLGITSLSEAEQIGYYSDGTYRIKESFEMAIWYNMAGYVGDWAVDGVLFVGYEVNGVHGSDMLGVGQFPDSLDAYLNQSISVKFGFLANNRIELINITANITEKPPIEGTIIDTQNLDVYLLPNVLYKQDSFLFDLDKTLTDLDIASLDEALPIVFAEDGSYTDEKTVENGGYWLSRAGYWAIYDKGAVVWISHENFEDGYFGIGQYPDSLSLGEVFTIKYALLANEKIELLSITIHVDEPPPPPAIANTQELYIILHPKTGEDYSQDSVQFDLDQTLADLGIVDLSEAIRIAVNEDGTYTDVTDAADGTGFWLGKNGYKADWGAGGAVYVTSGNVADGYLGVGQYPDGLSAGDMFTVMYGFYASDKIEMFNLTIDVRNVGIDEKEFPHQGIMHLESPVRNELRVAISANELGKATLTIYSITGEIVYTGKDVTEFEEIDLGHISSGVYFLHFNNGTKRETEKFIKH